MRKHFVAVFVLFLITFVQIGTDLYLPSFAAISNALQTNVNNIQLTFSVFLAAFAISQLIYGPLSDRYGRKPFLLIGISLYFLMSLVAAFSTTSDYYDFI